MDYLDTQMQSWSSELQSKLKLPNSACQKLATTISDEVDQLSQNQKWHLAEHSVIPLRDRLDELQGFQMWMDYAHTVKNNPGVTRAQVITQNYMCFTYLSEAWFRELRKSVEAGTVTKKCCKFLTDNPVRAFRNAIAHSNWRYKSDFSGIEYWSRKGDNPDEVPTKFEVSQSELGFWQALARCTAYASFLAIESAT